jgi:hypothetical protein
MIELAANKDPEKVIALNYSATINLAGPDKIVDAAY